MAGLRLSPCSAFQRSLSQKDGNDDNRDSPGPAGAHVYDVPTPNIIAKKPLAGNAT